MEFVGPKRQTMVGIFVQVSYPIGIIIQPSFAYFIRDDFWLQIATMSPFVLLIPFVILYAFVYTLDHSKVDYSR
jgi:hypothetical protein